MTDEEEIFLSALQALVRTSLARDSHGDSVTRVIKNLKYGFDNDDEVIKQTAIVNEVRALFKGGQK